MLLSRTERAVPPLEAREVARTEADLRERPDMAKAGHWSCAPAADIHDSDLCGERQGSGVRAKGSSRPSAADHGRWVGDGTKHTVVFLAELSEVK